MPLPTAQPWKHPDSGISYVRRAVPVPLRTLVGRAIEMLSLRTKDPEVARARFVGTVHEMEARWATLAASPKVLALAAAGERDPVERWVPLACAYSEARLSEVCQLRVEDFGEVDGIAVMRFDAEADSLKTLGSECTVPRHSALVAVFTRADRVRTSHGSNGAHR